MKTADLSFVVKICGITREQDARVSVETGANALGFNFYRKSPRYVLPAHARRIAEAVPGPYLRVGVFVNATAQDVLAVAAEVPLDVLQLHGNCEVPDFPHIWKSVPGEGPFPEHDTRLEAYLLDAVTPGYGGSGTPFVWKSASAFPHRAIVAGGLDAANVAEAIGALRPWGVDACSRLESRPGCKDPRLVGDFVHAALAASRSHAGQEVSL